MLDMKNFEIDENELDKVCGGVTLVDYNGIVYEFAENFTGLADTYRAFKDENISRKPAQGWYIQYFRGNELTVDTLDEFLAYKNSGGNIPVDSVSVSYFDAGIETKDFICTSSYIDTLC